MSKATRITFTFFLALSFFFSAFITVLRVIALESYEISSHYFAFGATLPDVINYLLFATVLIFFVCGLYLRGRISLSPTERGVPFYFSNAVLGASLAAYAIFSFPIFFTGDRLAVSASPFSGGLLLFCTLFAVAGVFFCIHNCLFPNAERSRRLIFGLSIPLFAVLNVLALYFDTLTPLNAPNKLFDQFSYVFIALYLLYELRVLFSAPRYAAQCTFGFIAMIFTAANGFPSFIYMCRHGVPLSDNAAHDVLMISFFIYTATRMAHILFTESARDDRVLALLTEAEHPAADFSQRADSIEGEEANDEDSQLTFDTLDALAIESISLDGEAAFSEDGRQIGLVSEALDAEILEDGEEELANEPSESEDENATDDTNIEENA